MDGKLALLVVVMLNSACQLPVKQKKNQIIDDSNSTYSSKPCYGEAIPNRYIVRWKNGETTLLKGVTKDEIEGQILAQFKNEIDVIEQDRFLVMPFVQNISPQETDLPEPSVDNWGQSKIEVQDLWDQNILGENIIVAVVDSGVDISHPQLKNQIYINTGEIPENGIDDDKNGFIDDYNGYDFFSKSGEIVPVGQHGTHVAGVIAAQTAEGPIQGLAPKAKILPLNFMDHENPGGALGDAILAMDYAVKRGARIINASWGGETCSVTLKQTIDKLHDINVLFVAAAGNDGLELDQFPQYPASYRGASQLTVGAVVFSDRMAGFSNYSRNYVDLMAPGSQIWSTVPKATYAALSGTSMAAPFVTGAAALLWSRYPGLSVDKIKEALLVGSERGEYLATSKGRLNIKKALQYLVLNHK